MGLSLWRRRKRDVTDNASQRPRELSVLVVAGSASQHLCHSKRRARRQLRRGINLDRKRQRSPGGKDEHAVLGGEQANRHRKLRASDSLELPREHQQDAISAAILLNSLLPRERKRKGRKGKGGKWEGKPERTTLII